MTRAEEPWPTAVKEASLLRTYGWDLSHVRTESLSRTAVSLLSVVRIVGCLGEVVEPTQARTTSVGVHRGGI